MPQPNSHRGQPPDAWNDSDRKWPGDPAAARRAAHQTGQHPKDPPRDARTPDDKDGNEELEREVEAEEPDAGPSSQRQASGRERSQDARPSRARRELETEDTGEWTAADRFTSDDELEDTWPNVPARYLDD